MNKLEITTPKTVYIDDDKNSKGSDTSGDGSLEKPFLTELRAMKELPDGDGIIRDTHSRLVYCGGKATMGTSKITSPESIDWKEAQKWAEEHGQDSIIIVCRSTTPNLTHVLTWGRTPADSADAAQGGNVIKDHCWPKDAPHKDMPAWLLGLIEVYQASKECVTADQGMADYAVEINAMKTLINAVGKNHLAIESKIGK